MEKLKNHLKKLAKFESASSLLHWDLEVYMPKKAANKRAEIIGEIAGFTFREFISDKTLQLLENAENEAKTFEEKALIKVTKKEYERYKKIPPELFVEFQIETSKAHQSWQNAKIENKFEIFEPNLEKVIELTKEITDCLGYDENRYDALLDQYEPGLKTSDLHRIIPPLKDFLTNFLDKLSLGNHPNENLLNGTFNIEKQKIFSNKLLKILNFDFDSGRLDVSMHPFTITISHNDIRITTTFDEKDLKNSIFSTIHECGHALYEQGIPEELRELPIGEAASNGIHESQSRFWENIIGRSLEFWKYLYPDFIEIFPQFKDVKLIDFWRSINTVKKSLIRTEADEVTYNLHIMMRFEIEEALVNDKIKVKELPLLWNEKMKEYLGITPQNDSEGVLQDIHWSHGSFGYFPSYMLGNLYASQFYEAMKKDIKNINSLIENGKFNVILNWLREKIHSKGKLFEPKELLKQVTNEPLNPSYFINYIKDKYEKVYML
ncbi:MAG: carboxypeptidase M32 [Thermosipho sp. (in: Bacteria)]|nr:carboxypeptidase M32 [Thermosipho sp. (in: thermotogales)]